MGARGGGLASRCRPPGAIVHVMGEAAIRRPTMSPDHVGPGGLEPPTSSLSGMRSNQAELRAPKGSSGRIPPAARRPPPAEPPPGSPRRHRGQHPRPGFAKTGSGQEGLPRRRSIADEPATLSQAPRPWPALSTWSPWRRSTDGWWTSGSIRCWSRYVVVRCSWPRSDSSTVRPGSISAACPTWRRSPSPVVHPARSLPRHGPVHR